MLRFGSLSLMIFVWKISFPIGEVYTVSRSDPPTSIHVPFFAASFSPFGVCQ